MKQVFNGLHYLHERYIVHRCTNLYTFAYIEVVIFNWRYVTLVFSVVVVVIVIGVCNHSQMRTTKCTCLIFDVNIGLDPG